MRVTRRVIIQNGSNKHSSKNAATKSWKDGVRQDKLQARFDRLAGPVTVTYKDSAKDKK